MVVAPKAMLRSELLAARRAVAADARRSEAERLADHLSEVLEGAGIVCAYVPMETEPGSPEMLDELSQQGRTVLLPIARTGPNGEHLPLEWSRYRTGELVSGPFGTREPSGDRLPSRAVATADIVLVPALAVDRRGVRLGRGGGFYDRSLALCGPGTRLVAVVRDCELLDEVPAEPHDVRMTHALTPGGGLTKLSGMPIRR